MDNPFAYTLPERTSFQQPLRTHASEIDISSRRATYEHVAPMQRRRPKYTRSKTGCLTCRKKKVKCDEAKPDCERCASSGRTCTWPEPAVPRRLPLVGDEAVYNWNAEEGRPYTASSSAGLSDASSTPSSLPESPHHAVITGGYEDNRLAPGPYLSRRHSAPSLKSSEKPLHPSPMRQIPVHHPHVATSVQSMPVTHAPRQSWNGPSNHYGAPVPPQMASSSYPPTSQPPTAAPAPTGLSPIPELSSLPYSHFAYAHSDDAIAAYSTDVYPAVRHTVPSMPHADVVPTHALSGLIAVKQEFAKPLELSSSPHHSRVSYPDTSALSWDQYNPHENTAAPAYPDPSTYSHEYYADENPSPEPVWPMDSSYAHYYTRPYAELHETYQSTPDNSAHGHAPVIHQPQPMQPAVIPYHQ
ncbi:unnamed protein product [Peniophora sp. CBMAI 1063]|nr:unnamed protein product [Peniophora sp. CBMAI 1063]